MAVPGAVPGIVDRQEVAKTVNSEDIIPLHRYKY